MSMSPLALEFSRQMRATLSAVEMLEAINRNRAEPVNSGVCHTHDFCDANMVMLAAFVATFNRDPAFLDDSESPVAQDEMNVWNAAWSEAVREEFNV